MKKLTYEQECFICEVIGAWYVKWKNDLVDYKTRTHRLGRAREDLKEMICNKEMWDNERS
jgi:hypothetical protein